VKPTLGTGRMHVNDTRVVIERMRIQSNARTEKCVCVQEEAEEGEAKATAGVVAAVAGRGGWWSGQWRWSRGGVRSHGGGSVSFSPRQFSFNPCQFRPYFSCGGLGLAGRVPAASLPFPCHRCRRCRSSLSARSPSICCLGLVFALVRPSARRRRRETSF